MQVPHPKFKIVFNVISRHCCCLVAKLCSTLCNPMNCSTPEFAQTHDHRVCDAIQPSHPLLPLSSLVLDVSQHQGLFQWVSSSHQVAKVLELQLQHPSFWEYLELISFSIDWFDLLDVQGLSRVFSSTKVQKHQFFSAFDPTFISIHDYWKNHSFDYMDLCWQSDVSAF